MENKEMDNMYPRQNTVAAGQYSQRNEEVDEAGQYRKKFVSPHRPNIVRVSG